MSSNIQEFKDLTEEEKQNWYDIYEITGGFPELKEHPEWFYEEKLPFGTVIKMKPEACPISSTTKGDPFFHHKILMVTEYKNTLG